MDRLTDLNIIGLTKKFISEINLTSNQGESLDLLNKIEGIINKDESSLSIQDLKI